MQKEKDYTLNDDLQPALFRIEVLATAGAQYYILTLSSNQASTIMHLKSNFINITNFSFLQAIRR